MIRRIYYQHMMKGRWFDQLVIVVLENHGMSQVQECRFTQWFHENGATFTDWHAETHPSGPNYRTLFSGQPWSNNEYDGAWRPSILDVVPSVTLAFAGEPADRHNPAKDMQAKSALFQRLTGEPLVPAPIVYLGMDDMNDAHSGSLDTADANVMKAVAWWQQHMPQALFCVTFDEAFGPIEWLTNHVFTGMAGPMVPKGHVTRRLTHRDFAAVLFSNWDVSSNLVRGDKPWWEA